LFDESIAILEFIVSRVAGRKEVRAFPKAYGTYGWDTS
jgi:hypothetical protein